MVQSNQQIPFPWKLHEMLEDCEKKGLSHIVSWLPDNRSLRVHDPPAFTSKVIGKYFKQRIRYFTRIFARRLQHFLTRLFAFSFQ
mmetsp:Transcript_15913/g.36847  ORF Transcript_15913/g.36847 Transcript_15913/m.36847 type:complete len:85 (+) Transcript_15913:254-508(+)